MKLASAERQTQTSGETSYQFELSLEDSVHILGILRDRLYSDKVLAVVREYASNAWDAHQEAGKADVPILVMAPTSVESTFRVRDYGLGMSPETINLVYTRYGRSTKRNSDTVVGALGLGAKCGFAYTDSFAITTWHEGTVYFYSAYLDESDAGRVTLLKSEPCDPEETGTEIKVPVHAKDAAYFTLTCREILSYMSPTPVGNVNVTPQRINLMNSDGYGGTLANDNGASGFTLVMGCVPYLLSLAKLKSFAEGEIEIAKSEGDTDKASELARVVAAFDSLKKHGSSVTLYVPIGAVSVSASREDLEYTEATLAAAFAALIALFAQSQAQFETGLSLCVSEVGRRGYVEQHKQPIHQLPLGLEYVSWDAGHISQMLGAVRAAHDLYTAWLDGSTIFCHENIPRQTGIGDEDVKTFWPGRPAPAYIHEHAKVRALERLAADMPKTSSPQPGDAYEKLKDDLEKNLEALIHLGSYRPFLGAASGTQLKSALDHLQGGKARLDGATVLLRDTLKPLTGFATAVRGSTFLTFTPHSGKRSSKALAVESDAFLKSFSYFMEVMRLTGLPIKRLSAETFHNSSAANAAQPRIDKTKSTKYPVIKDWACGAGSDWMDDPTAKPPPFEEARINRRTHHYGAGPFELPDPNTSAFVVMALWRSQHRSPRLADSNDTYIMGHGYNADELLELAHLFRTPLRQVILVPAGAAVTTFKEKLPHKSLGEFLRPYLEAEFQKLSQVSTDVKPEVGGLLVLRPPGDFSGVRVDPFKLLPYLEVQGNKDQCAITKRAIELTHKAATLPKVRDLLPGYPAWLRPRVLSSQSPTWDALASTLQQWAQKYPALGSFDSRVKSWLFTGQASYSTKGELQLFELAKEMFEAYLTNLPSLPKAAPPPEDEGC